MTTTEDPRPEPVLINGTAAGLGTALTAVLVDVGVNAEGAGKVGSWVAGGITLVLAALALWRARSKVTPVADPRLPRPTDA